MVSINSKINENVSGSLPPPPAYVHSPPPYAILEIPPLKSNKEKLCVVHAFVLVSKTLMSPDSFFIKSVAISTAFILFCLFLLFLISILTL